MALSLEAQACYIRHIDSILAASDLNTISEKRIRRGLQDVVDHDITPHKAAIKQLIMQRFDIFAAQNESAAAPHQSIEDPSTNGHSPSSYTPVTNSEPISPSLTASPQKRSADVETPSEPLDNAPPKKKRKSDLIDSDALFAAKLQAEENLRARPTRGASTRKAAPAKKKKASKAKTSKKVKADDDSEVDGSAPEIKKEVTRTGGFHKPLSLSPPLSALLGGELSRPQTVKRLWQYIREHDLQDPADRRQIRCDDLMRAVFKQDRIHMFTMTKVLNQNLYTPDE
ncbi:hypothetical protein AJ80_06614 [Polytolypa hystricis UAMH7299]|uniref:Uncharacterized protein n=1 Tax=Polytolypa hystricis (strain UAMH7299) TaxID=1447883 RepID=A0A2B7XV67_POLH7|nr:hypothetical protein AJ80_06614 [Polytolypa hystricis UAMH7299]